MRILAIALSFLLAACATDPDLSSVSTASGPDDSDTSETDPEPAGVDDCTDPLNCETPGETPEGGPDEGTPPQHQTPIVEPSVNPVDEPCNGEDEDGVGGDDCAPDADQDGYGADVDCNDDDAGIAPFSNEVFCDGVDQNCNGEDECDADGDGVWDYGDCDPEDASVDLDCFGSEVMPDP